MSNSQRRAVKRYREQRRKRGLKRLEVQVPAGEAAVIRKAAAILRDQPEAAARLRGHLGFEPQPGSARSAFDVFAMTAPLSTEGEALWDDAMAQVERERRDRTLTRARDFHHHAPN